MTDVLIIGAGPAGLTAAIYAARAGVSVKVFDRNMYGGQTALTSTVDNYPGLPGIEGSEFASMLYKHATGQGAEIVFEEALEVELEGPVKRVKTSDGEYEGRTIILAGGATRRKLGCPGEDSFVGAGVSYCATCDAAFFRGKDVAIVGGGDTALNDALFLSNQCNKVYVIVRRDVFRAQKAKQDAVLARPNVEVIFCSTIASIEGDGHVERCALLTADGERFIEVSGVFVAIGVEPDKALYDGKLPTDAEGYITVGESGETPLEGVFVAGDVRKKPLRQIITAASDGATAAVMAAEYLNGMEGTMGPVG